MNAFIEHPAGRLRLKSFGAELLFGADEAEPIELELIERLQSLPEGGLLVVDFDGVRVASEAGRQLLRRALLRISGGELEQRFIVLANLERCRYSMNSMLRQEQLTAVARTSGGPQLLGQVDRVAAETFAYVASKDTVTAKMVFDHFGLQGIGAATNRLATLARSALVRKMGPRSLPTGGREYVFAAVQ